MIVSYQMSTRGMSCLSLVVHDSAYGPCNPPHRSSSTTHANHMLHRMYFTYANQYIHFNSKLGSNLNQLADLSHEGFQGNHYVDISFRLINSSLLRSAV